MATSPSSPTRPPYKVRSGPLRRLYSLLLILSVLAATFPVVQPSAPLYAQSGINLRYNFQPAGAPVPATYTADTGAAYGAKANGQTYGWLVRATSLPIDASGATRDRDRSGIAQELDTFQHMQRGDCCTGGFVTTIFWEHALPNGSYQVTVSAGDQPGTGNLYDSLHTINAEGVPLLNAFQATTAEEFRQATATVQVTDGRLTINADNGNNTKINYIQIVSATAGPQRPSVTGSNPANGATNVPVDAFVAVDVSLPNVGQAIDAATVTAQNVRLYRTSDLAEVPAVRNTTGGGDAVVLDPSVDLLPNTNYTFQITDGLKDLSGAAFIPFTMSFTTGANNAGGGNDQVRFEKVTVATSESFSGLTFGPDGKLYALTIDGRIYRWSVNSNGTLQTPQVINALQTANGGAQRLAVGIAFDPASTAGNLILWVSHTTFGFNGMADWGGKITRLSGPDLATVQDYVINLPRSIRDHVTNGIAFGPDGALYVNQGSNSAMGAADNAWGNRSEHALTAAVLRVNIAAITTPPLNVQTEAPGTYNPFAPGAAVTVFGSGVRNAYDLAWHSNGQLYVPTNGSAAGGNTPGNTPGTPASLPASCTNRIDDGQFGDYTGPAVQGISGVNQTQADFLFRVVQGGYYGHPNITRCEWVLNGGNPTAGTDPAQVNQYAVGTLPDRNWRGFAFDFANNKSPNGIIEYKSNTFNGALQGKLLVVRYSGGDDIIVLTPGGPNLDIINSEVGIEGFTGFSDPLELTENLTNGHIYVSEYGANRLTLLRPIGSTVVQNPLIAASASRLIFDDTQGGAASAAQTLTLRNDGVGALTISGISLTGADGTQFQLSNLPGLPAVLPPNGTTIVNVAFNPTTVGVKAGILQVVSDAHNTTLLEVKLRGLGKLGTGGTNEPSLQWILDTFEIPVNVGDDNASTNIIHSQTAQQSAPLLGEEISAQSFEKAGTGPVTVEVLAAFGPTDSNPVVAAGWYATGNAASAQELYTVSNSPASNGQRLNPPTVGSLSFDPGTTKFGFYSRWPAFSNRQLFSEDALNTFSGAIPHHVRVYPLKDSGGTVVPNAYIVTTEEHISGFDYQDIVLIVRNLRPAAVSGGLIDVENRDWQFPAAVSTLYREHFDHWLAFSRIPPGTPRNGGSVHESSVLRINNRSTTTPLTVTGLTISGADAGSFAFATPPTLPIVIPANSFQDVTVQFVATASSRVHRAQLTINSSDAALPVEVVQLGGFWQSVSEGGQEPNVQEIAQTLGFGTAIVNSGQQINNQGRIETIGEEILSPFWVLSNAGVQVYVRQLAAFHSCCSNTATVFRHNNPPAGNTTTSIFVHNGNWAQTILPRINGSTTNPAQGTFTPPNALFGFKIDPEWSDPSRNNKTPDDCSGGTNTCGHHVRFWPVRDTGGKIVANTFLMTMDYAGINYDFNDNVYYVANVRPQNAQVDVTAAVAAWPTQTNINAPLTYVITVRNGSIYPARGVTLQDTLPAGTVINSATPQSGSCTIAANVVNCALGEVAPETNLTVELTVTPSAAGAFANAAVVATSDTESNTTNNNASRSTSVVDPTNLPATLTIIMQADPEGTQTFAYAATGGIQPFQLQDPSTPQPNGFSAKVNFQNAAGAVPAGYFRDYGQAYGPRTAANQGTGQIYGWVNPTTDAPLDLSVGGSIPGNGRDRNTSQPDQRLDSLMHMQADDVPNFNGTPIEGKWEFALPNGTYQVTVAAGDPAVNSDPEIHWLNVEGVNAIQNFIPTGAAGSATHNSVATVTVIVQDGKLTVDAAGGTNTKINYIDIVGLLTPNRIMIENLSAGGYTVSQDEPAGWFLSNLVCVDPDNGSSIDLENRTASIDLDGGESVVCTFSNSQGGGNAQINGTVNFQGRTDQSGAIAVNLYAVGQTTPAFSFAPNADAAGNFVVSNIPAGTYAVAVKRNGYLQKIVTVTLAAGGNAVAIGELRGGDINNDGFVTGLDFTALAAAFNTQTGMPNFNAGADLNGDGFVTGLDFTMLASNFNTQGQLPGQ